MYKTQQKTTRFHLKSVVLRVEVAGFEPAAFWSRTKRATKLRYTSESAITALQAALATLGDCKQSLSLVGLASDLLIGHHCYMNNGDQKKRANRGTRTLDLLITNQLLYRLSHIGIGTEFHSAKI